MKKFVTALLDSMVARDPGDLPLAPRYAATENGRPSAPCLMASWRTVTAIRGLSQVVEDDATGNVVFTASLDESGSAAVLFGRLRIAGDLITEIELYVLRSRGDSGFIFLPDEMAELPAVWNTSIPESQKATHDELVAVGRAVYTSEGAAEYPAAEDCLLLECGGIVYEDAKYLAALQGKEIPENGKPQPIGGGLWPGRPTDPDHGQVLAADESIGVVVSRANIPGFVCPYVVDHENSSCFVPDVMLPLHQRTLEIADTAGKSLLDPMPATATVFEIVLFFDGKVQGMHRFVQLQAAGDIVPWPHSPA